MVFRKYVLFIVACMALVLYPLFSHSQKTMYRTIGHQTEGSEGRNVVQAADGGYFMSYYIYYAGSTIACIAKLNCAGQVTWERFFQEQQKTLPVDVIPQSDNGCLLLLSIRILNGSYQNAVLRLDEAGNTLWTQRLEMQSGNTTGCMTQHADGSIYTCGADSIPGLNKRGTAVAKLTPAGQLLWQKQYGEYADHAPRAITVTSDHKIVITGQATIAGLFFTNIYVMMLNSNGAFIKRKLFTTYYDDEVHSICADQSGNVALTGYSYFINTEWDMFFLKLDNQLEILQAKFYDGGSAQGEQARFISKAANNTFAIFGDEGGFNERNPALLKLDANGSIVWARRYTLSPQYTNYVFHGSQAADGGFLMTGDARPVNQFRIAPFIKTDGMGDMGCFNSALNLTARNEIYTELDTSILEFGLPLNANTAAVPYSTLSLPTSNTAFCQSLVPCGTFSWEQDSVCPIPCYTFSQSSLLASTWLWTFENGTPSTSTQEQPPAICFSTPGPHTVTLELTNPVGSVIYSQIINPAINCPLTIPNIFTPDGNNTNDVFQAKGVYEPFSLKIFNRWGLEVFSSDVPGKWWNGNSSTGEPAVQGVYFYILKLPQSDREFKGTVELVK